MKKITVLLTALILVLSLAACGSGTPADITSQMESPAAPPAEASVESDSDEPISDSSETGALTVTYYHGDENAEHIVSDTAEIPQLSPQALADLLCEKEVLSVPVTVNSCVVDSDKIIQLDLSGEFSQLLNSMGTTGETIIMGSLVNTFLDAFKADGVYIKTDGQELSTGHNIYDYVLGFYSY